MKIRRKGKGREEIKVREENQTNRKENRKGGEREGKSREAKDSSYSFSRT